MRLTPEQRHLMIDAVRRGINKSAVARVCGVTRATLYKWYNRAKRARNYLFRDRKAKLRRGKITEKVELSIIALRSFFKWGTARIQQGLLCLPPFMHRVRIKIVQGIELSRTAINRVLERYKLNGYAKKHKAWKFFRARRPNELWQLDIKGPFTVLGRKYWFVVCIDDYSRYLILAEQLDRAPTVAEIAALLEPHVKAHHPANILTDNNPFKEDWKAWCAEHGIKPLFAHPYYPQDKGKVERAIRTVSEEFIYLLRKFPEWLEGKIKDYKRWYNERRYHRGISARPAELYPT